jgi:hypothetical protein
VDLHSEQESFRGTLTARTPDNESATVIVLRRKQFVWLTFDGAIRTTLTLTDQQVTELVGLLRAAQGRTGD